MYFFRARYYHAELGRFISRDPIGYVDGMNLYRAYFVPAGVDPLGWLDATVGTIAGTACTSTAAATETPVIVVVGVGAAVGAAGVGVGYCIGKCTTGPVTEWVCDWWFPHELPRPRPIPRPIPEPKPKPRLPRCDNEDNCDCWCIGYQNDEPLRSTNIGWMSKEECLALSFKKSIPDTGETYEEICGCGIGWWE
jgi:hypothetical protein